MKTKTSDLTGPALDWAVAQCEGITLNEGNTISNECDVYSPSTDWAQGGPIIERAEITIQQSPERDCWMAHKNGPASEGPTPLIAAMRCYVASRLGDTIDIPEELL